MMQENRSGRQAEIHITQMRRNPYLVDYQTGKNTGRHTGRRIEQRHHSAVPQQENRIRQQKQKTAAAVSDGQYLQHAHKTTPDEGGETASPQTGKNPQIYPDDSALCRNSGRNRRIDKAFEGACQYCGSQHTDGSNRYGAAGGKRD